MIFQNRQTMMLSLILCVMMFVGCTEEQSNVMQPAASPVIDLAESGASTGNGQRFGTYVVEQLNHPISPWKLYFHVERIIHTERQSWLQVVVRRDKPFEYLDGQVLPTGMPQPYSYKWRITDDEGNSERMWLAHFIRNRDGTFHTIVQLPDDEWERSQLEVYYEDVDDDGVRDDATFVINVGKIIIGNQEYSSSHEHPEN